MTDALYTMPEFQAIDRALDLLGQTLSRPARCTAVGQATQTHNVVCQLEAHGPEVRHWAHIPGIGEVSWSDVPRIGHLPEVESGACDPDDVHDRAKETHDNWETGVSKETP